MHELSHRANTLIESSNKAYIEYIRKQEGQAKLAFLANTQHHITSKNTLAHSKPTQMQMKGLLQPNSQVIPNAITNSDVKPAMRELPFLQTDLKTLNSYLKHLQSLNLKQYQAKSQVTKQLSQLKNELIDLQEANKAIPYKVISDTFITSESMLKSYKAQYVVVKTQDIKPIFSFQTQYQFRSLYQSKKGRRYYK